jgi:RNA polymerase sigma factor (sigma-70 family)
LSDAQLLERWTAGHDEAAFEVVVWRHGPLILQLIRRLLFRAQDIEDAFQATFLALVRKAGSIRQPEAVASWLYKVAYRVGLRARSRAIKRATREAADADVEDLEARSHVSEEGLHEALAEEVNRLPAKYRATVVLCYLEGKTNAEAARQLSCPMGTIFSRLASARQLLQRRLRRRGVAIGPALLAVTLVEQAATAAVPTALADAALRAARWVAPGHATASTVSTEVIALTEGVLRTMFLARLKIVAAFVLALALIGGGVSVMASRAGREFSNPGGGSPDAALPGAPVDDPRPAGQRAGLARKLYEPAGERSGVLLVLGTEVKPSQKAPPGRLMTVSVGGQTRAFQRLQEGDTVEKGQVLAQLDDRLACSAVATRAAELAAREAELEAATKTRDEARMDYQSKLKRRGAAVDENDLQAAKLTSEKFDSEVASKLQQVKVRQLELRQAQIVLDMYQIRSQARGVIRTIYKQPGEGVQSLEPLLAIELASGDGKSGGAAGERARTYEAPSQQAGIVSFIGTPLKPGEKGTSDRLATVPGAGEEERYLILREGDKVEAGQLLARIDNRLARSAVAIRKAKLAASEADLAAVEKVSAEAERRFRARQKSGRGGAFAEEVRTSAELTWQRCVAEARSKKELVRVAELEWQEAQLVLEQYEIRSVVRGVIKAIYKHPGEGVKYLEPVFRIEASGP